MNKFWQKKPGLAVALLLLLVAIATLQSVLATNHAPQQVPSTTTETTTEITTVTITPNSSEIQPLSQYGVVRIQTTALNTGRTLYVDLNSTVGPIYLEQLQIVLRSPQSQDIVAAGVTLAGLSGPTCSGTIIKAGQLYGAFDFSTCTNPAELTDPAGNLAIAASPGTSNALSMQPIANAASPINGPVIVIATLCVPITATVTLTAMLQ